MRRLLRIASARHRPGPYRREAEFSLPIGAAPSETRKTIIGGRIGLPQLNRGIGHRITIAVNDAADQRNSRAGGAEARQIGPFRVLDQMPEGPDGLATG